ncbi:N-acyl-D-amino-acid deacylase family protein [Brevibacillus daliensis]|uniref:N-acyl-D-amino-acid deacylase family protein n=1 Tax=Brevibacillus daliensis TaxID=2892995 RepID=UPI001E64798D|nr:D-aminoacylase [Brevibacillus daliensis]
MLDVLIRGGMVCDGTGNPWTRLDIGVKDGRIAVIGKLEDKKAKRVIQAEGLVVAPGFIDPHVHSDLLCTKPDIHKIKVLQGVTTELCGQDGISVAPISPATKLKWQQQLKGLNGDIGDWPWETVDEYLSFIENSEISGNIAYLVPHGAVRTIAMGFSAREATQEEIKIMCELVEEGLKQGAFGFSSGIQYPPCVYSNKEELTALCKVTATYDGCFVVHIRNESNYSLEALDEVIDAARQSGVRLHVSHFKVCGSINRDKWQEALQKLDNARNEGIEVTFDQYPYTAASTVFQSILPPWMHDGGTDAMLKRLEDQQITDQVKIEMEENGEYDNPVRNNGWKKIVIASVQTSRNKECEGKSVATIAKERGLEPAEAAFQLLREEKAAVTMIIHWGEEEDILQAMQHPFHMVGSDGVFGGKPHPRLYGTFPRVLARYSRDMQVFPIWEAVRRMTSAPAQLLRLKDRGLLKEGYWADIVLFDWKTVQDNATYDEPLLLPTGIPYVLVNGEVVVDQSEFTRVTAGQVIRRGQV